jgi:hypothetical protein
VDVGRAGPVLKRRPTWATEFLLIATSQRSFFVIRGLT